MSKLRLGPGEYLEIYVIDGCPYCQATKDYVAQHRIPTKMYRVSVADKAKYKALHDMNTFPHVFHVKGRHKYKIGGYDALVGGHRPPIPPSPQ